MKKRNVFVIVVAALVLFGVMAAPAMAAKPLLEFNPNLTSDAPLVGDLAAGYTMTLGGAPGVMHYLIMTNPAATPAIKDGMYAFSLMAKAPQRAELVAYFTDKAWTDPTWLPQILSEIQGPAPFFYVSADAGTYALVDNFKLSVGLGSTVLTIDDDYPLGTYVYKGHLKATNGALLQVTISLTLE